MGMENKFSKVTEYFEELFKISQHSYRKISTQRLRPCVPKSFYPKQFFSA